MSARGQWGLGGRARRGEGRCAAGHTGHGIEKGKRGRRGWSAKARAGSARTTLLWCDEDGSGVDEDAGSRGVVWCTRSFSTIGQFLHATRLSHAPWWYGLQSPSPPDAFIDSDSYRLAAVIGCCLPRWIFLTRTPSAPSRASAARRQAVAARWCIWPQRDNKIEVRGDRDGNLWIMVYLHSFLNP